MESFNECSILRLLISVALETGAYFELLVTLLEQLIAYLPLVAVPDQYSLEQGAHFVVGKRIALISRFVQKSLAGPQKLFELPRWTRLAEHR